MDILKYQVFPSHNLSYTCTFTISHFVPATKHPRIVFKQPGTILFWYERLDKAATIEYIKNLTSHWTISSNTTCWKIIHFSPENFLP